MLRKAFVDDSSTDLPWSQRHAQGMGVLGGNYRLAILVVMFGLLNEQQIQLERVEGRVEIERSMADARN
jgi:hypothetical protein